MIVPNHTLTAYEKAKLARRGFLNEFPVPLDKIAKREGIRVELAQLDDSLSGMSFIKDNIAVIVLNLNHHPNRRRFTFAHEIGHHILHKAYLSNNVHIDKIVLHRNGFSSHGVDTREVQANAFAAELLMPKAELSKYKNFDLNDDDFISNLSKKLKVSTTALTYRLINLGLVEQA